METQPNLPPVFQDLYNRQQKKKDNSHLFKLILGLIFIAAGFGGITEKEFLAGATLLFAGLTLFPPTINAMEKRLKTEIPKLVKYAIVSGLVIISIVTVSSDDKGNINKHVIAKTDTLKTPQKNISNTDTIDSIATNEKSDTQISDTNREEKINHIFSPWDGSEMKLVFYVKDRMNDPDSFEHVKTSYWDKGAYLIVLMEFRGKNEFGAKVINYTKAKVDLDGNVLEIIDNE